MSASERTKKSLTQIEQQEAPGDHFSLELRFQKIG